MKIALRYKNGRRLSVNTMSTAVWYMRDKFEQLWSQALNNWCVSAVCGLSLD